MPPALLCGSQLRYRPCSRQSKNEFCPATESQSLPLEISVCVDFDSAAIRAVRGRVRYDYAVAQHSIANSQREIILAGWIRTKTNKLLTGLSGKETKIL